MGQEVSSQRSLTHNHQLKQTHSPIIEHQSFLKLRKTPFSNSVRISDSPTLFLENISTTLTKLLSERMGGNKLLTEEDIIRLIETCLYGLAHLQNNDQAYRDLNMDNIYYDTQEGVFRLLPIQLIYQSSYSLVIKGKKFRYLAPEMIIALRMEEEDLEDEILSRSNVFMLGMILLEVCTLKPSSECYDDDNFDIFDKVIQERLDLVRQLYPLKLVQLLALMLEYDYTKRLNAQELSIIVNEEVATERIKDEEIKALKKSMALEKQEKKINQINRLDQGIAHSMYPNKMQQQAKQALITAPSSYQVRPQQTNVFKNNKGNDQMFVRNQSQYQYQPKPSTHKLSILPIQKSPKSITIPYRQPLRAKHSDNRPQPDPLTKPRYPHTPPSHQQRQRKTSPRRETMGGSKYPSIIYQTDFSTKENKDDSSDFSLHRIKEEIERSRKRIQEFNRISPMELIEEE